MGDEHHYANWMIIAVYLCGTLCGLATLCMGETTVGFVLLSGACVPGVMLCSPVRHASPRGAGYRLTLGGSLWVAWLCTCVAGFAAGLYGATAHDVTLPPSVAQVTH